MDPLEGLDRDGFVVLRGTFRPALIDALHAAYLETDFARGMTVSKDRIMQPVPVRPPFSDAALVANHKILALLQTVLGDELVMMSYGSVVALPGAPAQPVHKDLGFLFEPPVGGAIPCYAVTVMVPLVDLDSSTGTTALYPGTHRVQDHTAVEPVLPETRRGDCYLLDYRLSHGGTANPGARPRPLLYLVYSRPWFVDHRNFREVPPLDLSPEAARALPAKVRTLFRRVMQARQGSFD